MAKKRPKPNKGKPVLTPEQEAERANERALGKLYTPEGVNAGNALINKFLQPGALGRVDENLAGSEQSLGRYGELQKKASTRDPMQDEVLGRMKGGLDGYTSQQYQAQREQMQRGIQSNAATSMSQLARAQARGKVYGAAGVAQQQNLLQNAQNTKDNMEQDLYVKNIDEMRSRNLEYGQYGRGLQDEEFSRQAAATKAYGDEENRLRQEELERQKINLGQTNSELAAQIGAFTGAAGTALSQKNTRESNKISREGIRMINGGSSSSMRARSRAGRR